MVVLATSALVFAGNDPWTSKPYQQWDDKDIAKVLKISPWSHTEAVEMTWRSLSIEDIQSGQGASGQSGSSGSPAGTGLGASAPLPKGASASVQQNPSGTFMPAEHDSAAYTRGPAADFMVYWSS